ncbi:unnamed protein product [Linum tenue]|uniref:Uncharacterized protein n=1 Tax=Linum tenue TaxID=586396 RepID=A0AAV0IQ40_9ROSI|nr:unnamed protein product [Linum tenue]
MVRAELFTSK